jgi:hypothetical protein
LAQGGTQLGDGGSFAGCLDPFRDAGTGLGSKMDESDDERSSPRIICHASNQRHVDLDKIGLHAHEMIEVRDPAAGVVHGNPNLGTEGPASNQEHDSGIGVHLAEHDGRRAIQPDASSS